MTELVAIDVGGTHARFATADLGGDGGITLGAPVTLQTADYSGLADAWQDFAARAGRALPPRAAIAAAGPLLGDTIKLTNAPWHIDLTELRRTLGLEEVTALNDFAAVAHAVARAPDDQLVPVCGPDRGLPAAGTISVIGPGTGLGVAHFYRHAHGYHVQATEGGHIGFAPQDEIDDSMLAHLRAQHGRVVTERINAGPGIVPIYHALGGTDLDSDRDIWRSGIEGSDELARLAVERFCASLGAAAGDYALVHGAGAVVLAGGLCLRMRDILLRSRFAEAFCAKPRYEAMMADIPVRQIIHPQPGLFGAAAAFQREHGL